MRTVAEHQEAIRALLAPLASLPVESVRIDDARNLLGRVLASDLVTPVDLPPFDNSQMDGYAVRAAEIADGPLRVAHPIAAGQGVGSLVPGTAAPIMTGAPVPVGADAIIPIEQATPDTFFADAGAHLVAFGTPPKPGAFVRRQGSDLAAGGLLLAAGSRLGPAQCGVIAASGIEAVPVHRRPRVLVISSGDELRQPSETLGSGQIFDANRTAMAAALTRAGADVVLAAAVTDDAASLTALLATSAPSVDLVLTTGGVSKGAYEVVREVLEPAGVEFGSVAMQPGGPQGWGEATLTDAEGAPFRVPVIAFPGNPVSALVSFEMFLRAVLEGEPVGRMSRAPLAAPLDSPPGKHQVRRGRLRDDGRVDLVGGPSSHLLHGYATSTLLVHIPLGVSTLAAGDDVEIWSIE